MLARNLGIRRLRSPRAGDRGHRQPADQPDERRRSRRVRPTGDAKVVRKRYRATRSVCAHAAVSVPPGVRPAQEADFPAWECPHPAAIRVPAPWLSAGCFRSVGGRTRGGRHAYRVVGYIVVVDPVGGGQRREQERVRDWVHPLRRSAARRDRRPRRVARFGRVPLREPARRLGRGEGRPHRRRGLRPGRCDGLDDGRVRRQGLDHLRRGGAPAPPRRAGDHA